jgi:hypothetical protein
MGDISPREFGEVAANVATLLDHQKTIRADLARQEDVIRDELATATGVLFGKIDTLRFAVEEMRVNGCTIGRQHSVDIKELKEAPSKLVAIGAMIIAALASLGGGAIWLHSKLNGGG